MPAQVQKLAERQVTALAHFFGRTMLIIEMHLACFSPQNVAHHPSKSLCSTGGSTGIEVAPKSSL
jgi:hypothetical protein